MKSLIILAVALCGCTSIHVKQTDTSTIDEAGIETREIHTEVSGRAWFSSAQALTKFKVSQTDHTQSTGFDALNQHGATNTVATLEALARIAEAAAKIAP